jgi:hypothetical protein
MVVTGATGLIGRSLVPALSGAGYRVVVLARDVEKGRRLLPEASEFVRYALRDSEGLEQVLDGVTAVVNLAGESIFKPFAGRMTLRRVTQDRIDGTRRLAQACARAKTPPRVFVQASSVGVYGFGPPAPDTVAEDSVPLAGEHSTGSLAWGRAATEYLPTTRVVLLRLAWVLAADGSFAYQLAEAAKGKVSFFGPGNQWAPWIHLADVVAFIVAALGDSTLSGPYNLVAPESVTAAQFAETLARVTGARAPSSSARFFAHLFLGPGAITVLNGRHIVPQRLREHGWRFRYADLEPALRDLCRK